ncbi:hypothetical protein GQ600_12399 [Phytophthora cactorum]|nr:hypothetical protein GQ600_12399 [Phytophthora cactorum]
MWIPTAVLNFRWYVGFFTTLNGSCRTADTPSALYSTASVSHLNGRRRRCVYNEQTRQPYHKMAKPVFLRRHNWNFSMRSTYMGLAALSRPMIQFSGAGCRCGIPVRRRRRYMRTGTTKWYSRNLRARHNRWMLRG